MTGLTQLVAVGAQDVFLTSNSGKSLWTKKCNRIKNFAVESIEQTPLGDIDYGRKVSFVISRNGDLVTGIMLEITLQRGGNGFPYYPPEHFIDRVEIVIGGQIIDTITHQWFRFYWELFMNDQQQNAYQNMTNFNMEPEGYIRKFYVPIPFWFSTLNSRSSALPLIALQYHEVQLNIHLTEGNIIQGINPLFQPKLSCWVDYVFLDSEERIDFASKKHAYLIEQHQEHKMVVSVGTESKSYNMNLNFNHPVTCLIWALTPGETTHGQYTSEPGEQNNEVLSPIESAVIKFNGIDRFDRRSGSYFSSANPWIMCNGKNLSSGIYMYAFGFISGSNLNPPRGSMNFSRIDSAILSFTTKKAIVNNIYEPNVVDETMTTTTSNILNTLIVYACNYNMFRVESGMGGLLFAN
jgi:hypothetical protein